jgi:hypothetical protein
MTHFFAFKDAVAWISLPLFIAAFVTMAIILREVSPSLNNEDRTRLKELFSGRVRISGAINRAWSEHYRLFPGSRKRVLFVCLLIGASLSPLAYPLWLFLTQS